MSAGNSAVPFLLEWLHQWWPALALGLVVVFGISSLIKPRSGQVQIDAVQVAKHEIRTTLGCSEKQAEQLLAIYGGNSAKAIQEVKTGKAVLPGSEVSDLALFGGESRRFVMEDRGLLMETHDGRQELLDPSQDALLVVGVVDPQQRANNLGMGRADRGKSHGQLFWKVDGQWMRFLMTSSKMDYFVLGDKKENSAIRNFRLVVDELRTKVPNLCCDDSVKVLVDDLRAPLYKTLSAHEAHATQQLRNWDFSNKEDDSCS